MNVFIAMLLAAFLCIVDLPGVDAKCGTKDDANIVTINSNLAISVGGYLPFAEYFFDDDKYSLENDKGLIDVCPSVWIYSLYVCAI